MFPFLKMHGCGNDFVVIDNRDALPLALHWAKIADRHNGIGCDQVVVLERSKTADVRMRIFNNDGSESSACGNASRCVGWLIGGQAGSRKNITIETLAGLIEANVESMARITIDMGAPKLEWQEIPLAAKSDTLHLDISQGELSDPVALSMGNPHMVFFVESASEVKLETLGPVLEQHALFPQRANVGVAQVNGKDSITLRVWERGAGLTQACGTGACAALVAASSRGLTGRKATVHLPGGELFIEWRESDSHVLMSGPAALSFKGSFDLVEYAA